jgi:ABC-type transporter lipoprotein component MlaA
MTSNHIRNSLHAFIEAEGDEVEVVNAVLAKHPFKAMNTQI